MKKYIKNTNTAYLNLRRKKSIKKNIFGSDNMPRVSIFRSINHLNLQIINDYKSLTIMSFGTYSKNIKYILYNRTKCEQSFIIGKYFSRILYRKGIKKILFDRNGHKYKGRITKLIQGIRLIKVYL